DAMLQETATRLANLQAAAEAAQRLIEDPDARWMHAVGTIPRWGAIPVTARTIAKEIGASAHLARLDGRAALMQGKFAAALKHASEYRDAIIGSAAACFVQVAQHHYRDDDLD